ncbi:hypothetical protein BOX15_Mlig009468g2 [Macrostomum lignano]|uniref:CUE domain-containing protein n=1 Tax=Macrostomum lignano TaxID=282301 RepID=A0A267E9N0_9PLAT|nr:hypothetical protein BOX15_Mlig008403g1 [Macrostomum lignano]PAA58406.1 hypothetical protein BOX15_Mlig009468g2 [Macrostomum lignano]
MASGGGSEAIKLIERSLRQFVIDRQGSTSSSRLDFDADPSLYPYLEAVLTDDIDAEDGDCDDDSVLELVRAYVPLLESVSDADLRGWLADCRQSLADAAVDAAAPLNGQRQQQSDVDTVAAAFAATAAAGGVVRSRQSESSNSTSSCSSTMASAGSGAEADAEAAESLGRLRALFPEACAARLRVRLAEAGGDLQQAASRCLEADVDGGDAESSLACPRPPCACLAPKFESTAPAKSGASVKSYILSRFENYQLPDEDKIHRPEARFDERPRKTRYLDSRVVAQNGARYVEIKDEREEEIRKATTVCLKPARKYRFH